MTHLETKLMRTFLDLKEFEQGQDYPGLRHRYKRMLERFKGLQDRYFGIHGYNWSPGHSLPTLNEVCEGRAVKPLSEHTHTPHAHDIDERRVYD